MKVQLNERSKNELIYIQKYFEEEVGLIQTLGHYANVAVSEYYNAIRKMEIENGKEQTTRS